MDASPEIGAATRKDEFKEHIRGLLPTIDAYLSSEETPLAERLFRAGIIIVEKFIIEVSGDNNKDDFAEKPWFAVLYYHIQQWYREQYGHLLDQNPSGFARGVVLIRNFPIEIKVPLTTSRVETPGETAWLNFPVNIDSNERPLDWLVNPPPRDHIEEDELDSIRQSVFHVACSLRSIRNFSTGIVSGDDEIVHGLVEGVIAEMEGAASQIIRNDRNSVGPALWSIQMACERALKAFCHQRTGSYRMTHDLFLLFDDAAPHGLNADRNLLKALPRSGDIVDCRYGVGQSRSLQDAAAAYDAGLSFVSATIKSMTRTLTLAGGGVLLRRAPWITLPP